MDSSPRLPQPVAQIVNSVTGRRDKPCFAKRLA